MGLVKVEINVLRGYINCEHLIILTCKLGSKTIVLRYTHTTALYYRHPCPPELLEHAFPTIERPETRAFGRADSGIGSAIFCGEIIWNLSPLIVLKLGKGALVGAGTSVDGNSDVRVFNVFI